MRQRCHFHPETETLLTCGNCGKLICTRCVVQHPVGIRCPQCARPQRLPVFEVTPLYYARAVAVGLAAAIGSSILIVLLLLAVPMGGLFLLLSLAGSGYVIGEGISWSVNRKRSRGLQVIGGVCVLLCFVAVTSALRGALGLYSLLALVAALYIAINRLPYR